MKQNIKELSLSQFTLCACICHEKLPAVGWREKNTDTGDKIKPQFFAALGRTDVSSFDTHLVP